MKNLLIILVALLVTGTTYAQKMAIRGQLLDSAGSALPSATVLVLNHVDSSLVNFGVTNASGYFELKNLNRGTYLFRVTYVGYKTITKRVSPKSDEMDIDLGALRMEAALRELDELVIQAERAPVVVKKDTIEFNASSFKTQQNAMVEDLLKKLPGVEVDQEGNIDAQGERVQRVTVDGREFFGRDPKIATRNLPADAVDKVQVFDKKSDQALFTGIDDGQKEKTINLELKEEKRKGAFGNLTGGIGNDDRFTAKASINKFGKTKQFSVLGMANNVNEQGFSIDDYMNFTGGSAQMMGGGGMRISIGGSGSNVPLNFGGRPNGIMTNYAGGLNFNNDFSDKTKLTSNYFVNFLDHFTSQTTYQENRLPTETRIFNQNSVQNNSNINHRANLTLDHQLDSANSLKLTTGLTYNETESESRSTSETINADPNSPNPIYNSSDQRTTNSGTTTRFNSELLVRHKFKKKGRTLSSNFQFAVSDTDREGFLVADNKFYFPMASSRLYNQRNEQVTDNTTYGGTFSYTEPLGNRRYLEANYSISKNRNEVLRDVFDIDGSENETRNDTLSSRYTSNYQYQRGGINLRVNRNNYNFTVGASMQSTELTGAVNAATQTANIDRTFNNILPVARLNYDFSSTKHLSFEYETSMREPSIQQLQPIRDNSDPLNVYVGNPNLRPSYQQNWSLRFNTFNPLSFVSFFTFVDVTYENNAITNSQTYDSVRTTMPVNVDNALSTRANLSFNFPINKLKSRISLSGSYRNSQTIAVVTNEGQTTENHTNQNTYGGTIRYNFRYKEILDLSLSSQLSYQTTQYEFDQNDQTYFNQTHGAQANLTFLKNFQFVGDFDYMIYQSNSTGFDQTIPILNLSLSRFILKNKKGELKLSVNNALDQNSGVTQSATGNSFEIQTINSLGRYYMLSFTYALNKHLNPMGGRRGGFRMIRQ